MSAQLVWELVKNSNAFLRKSVNHTVFTAEPGNLTNLHRCAHVRRGSSLGPCLPLAAGWQARRMHCTMRCSIASCIRQPLRLALCPCRGAALAECETAAAAAAEPGMGSGAAGSGSAAGGAWRRAAGSPNSSAAAASAAAAATTLQHACRRREIVQLRRVEVARPAGAHSRAPHALAARLSCWGTGKQPLDEGHQSAPTKLPLQHRRCTSCNRQPPGWLPPPSRPPALHRLPCTSPPTARCPCDL